MNYNKAIILGRLTQNPDARTTPGGQPVTTIGIATNRSWTDKTGTKQESVEFHTVIAWGKLGELAASFLTKGSLVLVEGRLETRSWTDKDGVARKVTEIIASEMQFGPSPTGPKAAPAAAATTVHKAAPVADDELRIVADDEDTGRVLEPLFADDEIKPEDIPF